MKLISHRANLFGSEPSNENRPTMVKKVSSLFDVEVDIFYVDSTWMLGHDAPQYRVSFSWLMNLKNKLWIHCKNFAALEAMQGKNFNYFWHEKDTYTLTSKGYIWTFPQVAMYGHKNVLVDLERYKSFPRDVYGVCSDFLGLC